MLGLVRVWQDATSLGKLVRLTHLDVSHNALTDCLKIEPPLPQLRYARLCHNSIAVLRPLAGFRNLQVTIDVERPSSGCGVIGLHVQP
jgi:hypothetical protein